MELLIAKRRKDWKKRTLGKIENSNTFVSAMYKFIDEYLYYSRDCKELRRRLKKLLWKIDEQLSTLIHTRKTEFCAEDISQLQKDFKSIFEKLEK